MDSRYIGYDEILWKGEPGIKGFTVYSFLINSCSFIDKFSLKIQ